MPPKKKQEQIDLSTLPECTSINIFLYCKGKQDRAKKILSKIDSKFSKSIFHATRAQVLDYAKQKSIYVDPDTLTDKQKKDAKFMESICTQLTPQVLAKATDAYINNQNVKIRLQKKAQAEKPVEEGKQNKIDCIYIFDDFPTETTDFEALTAANQGIKYIFVIEPKITWASAPQQPQPVEDPDEQPQQDQQYQQFKKLKQAQTLTGEDETYDKSIQQKLSKLKNARKLSARSSAFRNTVVDYIKCNIDPYAEQASIQQAANTLFPRCEQLFEQSNQFNTWVKDKQTQKLPQVDKQPAHADFKYRTEQLDNTTQVLHKILNTFSNQPTQIDQNDDQISFDNFDFQAAPKSTQNNQSRLDDQLNSEFIRYNEKTHHYQRNFVQDLLANMKYPGVDRFLMPDTPVKSEGLRKLYRSSFGQFLPENWQFGDFQRKMDILQLQATAKQADQQRNYDFKDRIYEQQHTKQSLLRQLNKAMLFDQSTVSLKYDQNNDKLYVCMLYKNPARRMSKKIWQCNWKVLPNFESWLKYFKDNQNNLNNTNYYDIDYELIGNIQQESNVFSVKEGGAIIRKKSVVAGKTNQMLYCIAGSNTGDLIFGLRNKADSNQFYAQNQIGTITMLENQPDKQSAQQVDRNSKKSYSIYFTFKDHSIIQCKQNGDVLVRRPNEKSRLVTRDGYTIIYEEGNRNVIYHPSGGISVPPVYYVNQNGRGINKQRLHQVATLKRVTQEGQAITRRDDHTVIIEQPNQKWIKFPDGTQYLLKDNAMTIQKTGFPLFKFGEDGTLLVSYHGVDIKSDKKQGKYQFSFTFNRISRSNRSQLLFSDRIIRIFDGKTDTPYICSIKENGYVTKSWDDQSIMVSFKDSKYQRNSKQVVDPQQDEQNYNEEDVLKEDYLQPRIFVVNNDSTGIQLFSDAQLTKQYLQHFDINKPKQIQENQQVKSSLRTVPHYQFSNKSIVHGIVPIPHSAELNKTTIKTVPVNLDVFKNEEKLTTNLNVQKDKLQLRSLIKHKALTPQDRQSIAQIIKQRSDWQAKSEKDDNQFGYKPRNDPSTLERFQSKKKTLQFRKLKQQQILSQKMKHDAIQIHNNQTQQKIRQMQKLAKEVELRKKLSKKKSYVSQYQWKAPTDEELDENQNYYNPQGHFYANYFETVEGKKALSQMPDWVLRPKQKKLHQQLDPQIRSQLLNKTKKEEQLMNNTNQRQSLNQQSQKNQRYDTVQVDIRPKPQVYIKPSVFTQREIDQQRFAFETQKKAYEYHERKRKDYNVYGSDRKDKVQVPSLMRTQPVSELNQKYLVTEAPVDKKVKISSMKNKLTSEASNMTEMRKEGPHANLIRTIDKGNDYSKLLERRTMMVQADLNDRLQRDIQINPIQANFGMLKQGGNYQFKIEIKNQDVLAQRIQLKKPKSIFCKVQMIQMGPLALGMTRKVSVLLKAAPQIAGKFTDEFDIVTKHEIYHIPIIAQILTKNQFESSGSVLSKTVKEFEEVGKKKRQELPPIKNAQ